MDRIPSTASAAAVSALAPSPRPATAAPIAFGDCFGWLHHAPGPRGIVLCSAFGVEELASHRLLRVLAQQLAAAGAPVLRFDYHGTGDSIGSDLETGRVEAWLASVRDAVRTLRRETGVDEVALVGLRFGSLLATLAAAELGDIARLALIGAVPSGRAYVRELKALAAFNAQLVGLAPPAGDGEDLEVVGFTLTRESMAAIGNLDLLALPARPAAAVLLLRRADAPRDERLAQRLQQLGAEVEHAVLPGFAELEWNSTHAVLPPDAFVELTRWLVPAAPARSAPPAATLPARLAAEGWQEDAVRFGPDGALFGVLCRPALADSGDEVVLFVNHGANSHIGWARMYVELARQLAQHGIASLRFDIAGVGDSPAHAGNPENRLYATESRADVGAALDWLQQRGYRRRTLVGHCAGAYLAFYTALEDERVDGLVMVNLQRFFWHEGLSLDVEVRRIYRSNAWYREQLFSPAAWRRLAKGEVDVSGIARALSGRLAARIRRPLAAALARVAGEPNLGATVARWFTQLDARGTRVLLVYSALDGGLDDLYLHVGPNARRLRRLRHVGLRTIGGADHNLTPRWVREKYLAMLVEHLAGDSQKTTLAYSEKV